MCAQYSSLVLLCLSFSPKIYTVAVLWFRIFSCKFFFQISFFKILGGLNISALAAVLPDLGCCIASCIVDHGCQIKGMFFVVVVVVIVVVVVFVVVVTVVVDVAAAVVAVAIFAIIDVVVVVIVVDVAVVVVVLLVVVVVV
ncbi:hypothetical protein Tco_1444925, partial [Tanacetum coccineum]